jgi:hypothetical protein
MEPFNIKIGYGVNEVTLTILPIGEHQYKVIYYGAVLGGVKYIADSWEPIAQDNLEAGDLPYYHHNINSGNINVILDEATVDEIGEEIEHVFSNNEEI